MHGASSCQAPFASQVCGVAPTHFLSPGTQAPEQAPAAQTNSQSLCVTVSRSGPHSNSVRPSQSLLPGFFPMQFGIGSWQLPWSGPSLVSHSCLPLQTSATVHFMLPGSQYSTNFCACPAHASSLAVVHGCPTVPIAPASPASPPPSLASASHAASASSVTSASLAASSDASTAASASLPASSEDASRWVSTVASHPITAWHPIIDRHGTTNNATSLLFTTHLPPTCPSRPVPPLAPR